MHTTNWRPRPVRALPTTHILPPVHLQDDAQLQALCGPLVPGGPCPGRRRWVAARILRCILARKAFRGGFVRPARNLRGAITCAGAARPLAATPNMCGKHFPCHMPSLPLLCSPRR